MGNKHLIERYHDNKNKDNEYYTFYEDIEKELSNHKDRFVGKTIYCNCDNENSNFVKYFINNFDNLQLKHLVATCIEGYRIDYDGKNVVKTDIKHKKIGDINYREGDCFSPYCKEILKECDVVVTNPPFSFLKQYIPMLQEYNKDFIIIVNILNVNSKYVFPYLLDKTFSIGYNKINKFFNDNNDKLSVACFWLTTFRIDNTKQLPPPIPFVKDKYKTLYNTDYDIYIVPNVKEIPLTNEMLLVPITFVFYNTSEYEILGHLHLKQYAENYSKPLEPCYYHLLGETQKRNYRKGRITNCYYFNDNNELVSTFKTLLIKRKLNNV